jgi:hypothetical protein
LSTKWFVVDVGVREVEIENLRKPRICYVRYANDTREAASPNPAPRVFYQLRCSTSCRNDRLSKCILDVRSDKLEKPYGRFAKDEGLAGKSPFSHI